MRDQHQTCPVPEPLGPRKEFNGGRGAKAGLPPSCRPHGDLKLHAKIRQASDALDMPSSSSLVTLPPSARVVQVPRLSSGRLGWAVKSCRSARGRTSAFPAAFPKHHHAGS